MKVSLNWLAEFLPLPPTVDALVELLTLAGVEVEGVETRGVAIEKVVVAQILESAQHPNADRLSVCKVDDGSGAPPRQIVCGAKNYSVGDKVPLAQPGAVLPGDFKIKVGKLRGVESEGMLCSAKELGIAEDAAGLLILPPESRVGAPISELYPGDTILDVEITPNRADLLSYSGLAREVAALTGQTLNVAPEPAESAGAVSSGAENSPLPAIEISAPEKCLFYSAREISGITVAPSPAWLHAKLEASGIRAINNIVDITNLVMLETGQPLHAFDADRLRGGIRVRAAREGEEFLALDGRAYKLTPDDLLIADSERGIAIAGVMGGEESGVTAATKNVILESACFQASGIRRTSRRLGLMSDASYRFERGIDPAAAPAASQRAAELILSVAGGEVKTAPQTAGEIPRVERSIPLRAERCASVLGAEISPDKIDKILTGFGLEKSGADGWRVPSFRPDLAREIDLIEEVARVFGIENIPGCARGPFAPATPGDHAHDRDMRLRRALAAHGFYEARTLTLISENAAASRAIFHEPADIRRVRNPLTSDHAVLRPSLVPGLLATLENNVRAGTRDAQLFELGRVFRADSDGCEERSHLCLLMTGAAHPRSWREAKPRALDFFDLKGALESLGLGDLEVRAAASHPAVALCAELFLGGVRIGAAGQLWPAAARALGVGAPVLVAELDLSILAAEPARKTAQPIPRYPAVTRDMAMLAPASVTHGQVRRVLENAGESLLARVELFDLFTDATGGKLAPGEKSMAYSLTYRSEERTLLADEVHAAHSRLKERLKAELAVAFRE